MKVYFIVKPLGGYKLKQLRKSLEKTFDNKKDSFYAVNGVSLTIEAGQIYGTTTSDGQAAADKVLDVSDFNATIAWRLGIDLSHEEKSSSGRPFKLANEGEARKELFA